MWMTVVHRVDGRLISHLAVIFHRKKRSKTDEIAQKEMQPNSEQTVQRHRRHQSSSCLLQAVCAMHSLPIIAILVFVCQWAVFILCVARNMAVYDQISLQKLLSWYAYDWKLVTRCAANKTLKLLEILNCLTPGRKPHRTGVTWKNCRIGRFLRLPWSFAVYSWTGRSFSLQLCTHSASPFLTKGNDTRFCRLKNTTKKVDTIYFKDATVFIQFSPKLCGLCFLASGLYQHFSSFSV